MSKRVSMDRLLTIAQAADATGLTPKAIQRRIDRKTVRSVLRDGKRRIPVSELVRAELLELDQNGSVRVRLGEGPESTTSSPAGDPARVPVPPLDVEALLDRLERQAQTIGELRALTAHAESLQAETVRLRAEAEAERTARLALEQELAESRAALAAAAAEQQEQEQKASDEPRRGFWARLRGATAVKV